MSNHDEIRRAERRAHIEAALADYPHIDPDTLVDILQWFKKEATALDVGQIASNPKLYEPYQRLKAKHLDRFRGADLFWIAVGIVLAGMAVGLAIWAIV